MKRDEDFAVRDGDTFIADARLLEDGELHRRLTIADVPGCEERRIPYVPAVGRVNHVAVPRQVQTPGTSLVPGDDVPERLREVPHGAGVPRVDDPERVAALQKHAVGPDAHFIDVEVCVQPVEPLKRHERAQVGAGPANVVRGLSATGSHHTERSQTK